MTSEHASGTRLPDDAEALRERRRRLRDRVRSAPRRLDLREALAAVYRAEGNASQAGRWSYLADGADPDELRAFARSCQDDPVPMMRDLRWTGSEDDADTEVARERLRDLRAQAEARVGRPVAWETPPPDEEVPWEFALAVGVLVTVLALAVVGGVTVVRWLAGAP